MPNEETSQNQAKRGTFSDAFNALREVQASKSKNTIAQCTSVLKNLIWFEQNANDLSEFEQNYEGIWSRYKAAQALRPKENGEPRKLEHDRRYLVQALKRAERRGWVRKTFKKSDFDLFEAKGSPGKHIENDDVKKLLAELESKPKAYLQVLMAVTMGMRKSEILKLSKAEILWDDMTIRLNANRVKTRQARKVDIPITTEVEPLLRRFYDEAQGQFIFPKIDTKTHGPRYPIILWNEPQASNEHVWMTARKLAGLKCRFHDLRHTCASNLVSDGVSTILITQWLGMSETMLKNIYAHAQKKDQDTFRKASNGRFEKPKETTWKDLLVVGGGFKNLSGLCKSLIGKHGSEKVEHRESDEIAQ